MILFQFIFGIRCVTQSCVQCTMYNGVCILFCPHSCNNTSKFFLGQIYLALRFSVCSLVLFAYMLFTFAIKVETHTYGYRNGSIAINLCILIQFLLCFRLSMYVCTCYALCVIQIEQLLANVNVKVFCIVHYNGFDIFGLALKGSIWMPQIHRCASLVGFIHFYRIVHTLLCIFNISSIKV